MIIGILEYSRESINSVPETLINVIIFVVVVSNRYGQEAHEILCSCRTVLWSSAIQYPTANQYLAKQADLLRVTLCSPGRTELQGIESTSLSGKFRKKMFDFDSKNLDGLQWSFWDRCENLGGG